MERGLKYQGVLAPNLEVARHLRVVVLLGGDLLHLTFADNGDKACPVVGADVLPELLVLLLLVLQRWRRLSANSVLQIWKHCASLLNTWALQKLRVVCNQTTVASTIMRFRDSV